MLSGAAGFAHLWLNLPRWRLLGVTTSHRIVLPFAEVAYRLFLLVRPAAQALARKIDHGQIFLRSDLTSLYPILTYGGAIRF